MAVSLPPFFLYTILFVDRKGINMPYTAEQILEILPTGYSIVNLPEHINAATPFHVRCPKGHDWRSARIGNIKNNSSKCPVCSRDVVGKKCKLNEEEITNKLESFNYNLLSEYLGAAKKITIQCKVCGDKRISLPYNIKEACRKCRDIGRKDIALSSLDRRLVELKYTLLNEIDRTKNVSDIRLNLKCNNDHDPYWTSFKKFVYSEQVCHKCVGLAKLTLNDIRSRLDIGYTVDGVYVNETSPLIFTCPKGTKYPSTWNRYQQGHRCVCCSDRKTTKKLSIDIVKKRLLELNLRLVDNYSEYMNVLTEIHVQCTTNPNHLPFRKKFAHMYANSIYCPECQYTGKSKAQTDIENYLRSIGVSVISDRSLGFEIDIYAPEYKIGIEYCGLFYHNEISKDVEYHMRKWEKCADKGIKLITLYEDEYLRNVSLIHGYFKNIFFPCGKKIRAEDCVCRLVDKKDAVYFYAKYCVAGIPSRDIIELKSYGLYYGNMLVMVASFNISQDNGYKLLLDRYACCFDISVPNGLEYIIDHAINNMKYTEINEICFYYNRRFPQYTPPANFSFKESIPPCFDFVRGRERKTLQQLWVKDEKKEQVEILRRNQGWVKIYDCGHDLWVKEIISNNKYAIDNDAGKCWQRVLKEKLLLDDLSQYTFLKDSIGTIKIEDFDFSFVDSSDQVKCQEIKDFIIRYEWLGNMPLRPTHRFEARYRGLLAGVIVLSVPNAFSYILGDNYKNKEKLISRGATASWTPKNLASSLVMYSIRWMVKNTGFRVFTAYSDPEANEIGTIYQACNFYYLGDKFGSKILYFDPLNDKTGWFSDRTFRKINRVKKYAKECGIPWDVTWNDRWTVCWDKIPIDAKISIQRQMELFKERCYKKEANSKHKYCYILGNTKKETNQLRKLFSDKNTIYPYPKR